MLLTSSQLLSQVSIKAMLTGNQLGLTSQQIYDFATQEMNTNMVPVLVKANAGYLLYTDLRAISAGQTTLRMPYRGLSGTLNHIYWIDGNGIRCPVSRISEDQIEGLAWTQTGPNVLQVLIEGNTIRLFPTPTGSGTLALVYPFRPNDLVAESSCRQITAISGAAVTFASMPTGFTSAVGTGGKFDFIDDLSGNGIIYYDVTAASVSSNTITFSQTVPLAAVGNWVALAKTAPVPMVPEECHDALVEYTVARILLARNLLDPWKITKGSAEKIMEQTLQVMFANRVDSKPRIIGANGSPFLPRTW